MRWVPLLLLLLCRPALADGPPVSAYEDSIIQWGLDLYGREKDPSPENKRVEEVLIASEDIVSASDPYPDFVNWIHVRTRERIVRQEVLLPVGGAFNGELAEETERNLRDTFLFAVARVVAVKGSTPDAVAVLVVTKDIWSLRFNSAYSVIGTTFLFLRLRPSEQNLFGLGKVLSLDYFLERGAVSFGEIYIDRRLFGTRLYLEQSAALIFNRYTWDLEGTRGSLLLARPLYSVDTKWGFTVDGSWSIRPSRRYEGFQVRQLPYPDEGSGVTVPYAYDSREGVFGATVTRSFGHRFKANVSGGVGGYWLQYRAPLTTGLDDAQRAWLEAGYLPRSEDALYLQTSVSLFDASYVVLKDRESFALSEDYRLGYSAYLRLRWANPFWGSPSRFVQGVVGGRYRWLFRDNLITATAVASARYQTGLTQAEVDGPFVNRHFVAQVEELSPPLWIGRLVFRGLVDLRAADLSRSVASLGVANGLRGVLPDQLQGTHLVLFNVEYRTRSLELFTAHLGLVFFYDAGSAFERRPLLTHSLGVGLRILLPQVDREPIRIDFAWALNGPPLSSPLDHFVTTLGQATQLQPDSLDLFGD